MIIANDIGPIPQAWLDGATLDESCRGMRFRLMVGDAGGIICDIVAGTRDLTLEQVERLATHAVVNTDPLDDPLPITDDNGHPAKIVADPIHIQPISRIMRQGAGIGAPPPVEVRVVNPLAAMAIITGITATMAGIDWLGFPLAFLGALMLVRRTKVFPELANAASVIAAREKERRERLPEIVTQNW